MDEYIKREPLLRKTQKVATDAWKLRLVCSAETVYNQFIDYVKQAPAVPVREDVHARFETRINENGFIELFCTNCNAGFKSGIAYGHFCENCGATIDGIAENKKGFWISTGYYDAHKTPIYECSVCRKEVADNYIEKHRFCLHCGSPMEGIK